MPKAPLAAAFTLDSSRIATMVSPARLFLALVASTMLLGGCVPGIGDGCKQDADCPSEAICDSTAPGGYCTIPDCRPGDCPDRSICVEFDRDTSYCMKYCEGDSECRDGYTCRDGEKSRSYCYLPPS